MRQVVPNESLEGIPIDEFRDIKGLVWRMSYVQALKINITTNLERLLIKCYGERLNYHIHIRDKVFAHKLLKIIIILIINCHL